MANIFLITYLKNIEYRFQYVYIVRCFGFSLSQSVIRNAIFLDSKKRNLFNTYSTKLGSDNIKWSLCVC